MVDASALVAIGLGEPEHDAFIDILSAAPAACIAPINYVETGLVLQRHGVVDGIADLDVWLANLGVQRVEHHDLGGAAFLAYLRYGKRHHPAALNLADCFAYALAKQLDAPLLYKGDDFAKTDIRSALQPT